MNSSSSLGKNSVGKKIKIIKCPYIADEEFEDLCFEYGLEMEMGNGAEMNMARIDKDGNNIDLSKTIVYKLEVPANRYDLLCLEGIATALRSYLNGTPFPIYSNVFP
jgi:phenylalanyl-tRNA synthetase beta chain